MGNAQMYTALKNYGDRLSQVGLFSFKVDATGTITETGLAISDMLTYINKYPHYGHQTDKTETDEHYFTTRDIETSIKRNPNATVELVLQGFNSPRDFDVNNGMIALLDKSTGELIAGWTFRKLLSHWRRKHNRACYVPYMNHKEERTVEFGPLVTLGISTYFGLFLQAFHDGLIVFDPGDKAEKKNGEWIPHARSQFRTTMSHLDGLYNKVIETDIREDEVIDCR